MAQPTPYERQDNFTDHSSEFPSVPQPGVSLDAEFDAIKLTTDEVRTNLALIQRDDGALVNEIVTVDSLSAAVRALLGIGDLSLAVTSAVIIAALGYTPADEADVASFATEAFVTAAVAALVDAAPGALDTLNELAAALGDDANFAATVTTALAGKQSLDATLTAIAALSDTAYGRAFLELANQSALMALLSYASAAEIRAGIEAAKAIAPDQLIASAAPQTLTDGATVNWDMAAGYNAKVTIAGNRTLAVSNPVAGMTYVLGVNQDGTGSRTMTWPASFDWGTTGAPTLTTTASKRDRITLFCTDAATPKFDAFLSGKGFS